jgi:hypothetical protein
VNTGNGDVAKRVRWHAVVFTRFLDRQACDAMCSPLGVRTSFACRLPSERLLAAVRELEVDAGIHISYANRRIGR